MNRDVFRSFVETLGRTWETKTPDLVTDLFTEDATYQEDPFEEPLRGRPAIVAYWAEVPRTHAQVRFNYEILAVSEDTGVAHWWTYFVRMPSQTRVKLDGVFVASFNGEGRCQVFREWWRKQEPAMSWRDGSPDL